MANDVIVVSLSTILRPAPTHVELPAGEGGLKETSMAKCEQVTTLDKSFLIRGPFAGTINPFLMREIEKAIQRSSESQKRRDRLLISFLPLSFKGGPPCPTQDVKRKLTAILSADVKGYSRLMGEDEVGTIRTLNAYKEVMTIFISIIMTE